MQAFAVTKTAGALLALLHVIIFLFFAGFVEFVFSFDYVAGCIVLAILCFFGGIYIILTFLPIIWPNWPHPTPFSQDPLKWSLFVFVVLALLAIHCFRCFIPSDKFNMVQGRILHFVESLRRTMPNAIRLQWEQIDEKALKWLVEDVDDDDDVEAIIEFIPEFLRHQAGPNRDPYPIIEELLRLETKPLGHHHISSLLRTCTAKDHRGANENLRRHRALVCLDTLRFLTANLSVTLLSYELFGDETCASIRLLQQDEDPAIAISAISTGALAACTYLHFVFESRPQQPYLIHADIENLRRLVDAPWHKCDSTSFPSSHLLVILGFTSGLLPYLQSNGAALKSFWFGAVWESLQRVLVAVPSARGYPDYQFTQLFLALCMKLRELSRTARTIAVLRGANDIPPVTQLVEILASPVQKLQEIQMQRESSSWQARYAKRRAEDHHFSAWL
jgi:hypothetical protein